MCSSETKRAAIGNGTFSVAVGFVGGDGNRCRVACDLPGGLHDIRLPEDLHGIRLSGGLHSVCLDPGSHEPG